MAANAARKTELKKKAVHELEELFGLLYTWLFSFALLRRTVPFYFAR